MKLKLIIIGILFYSYSFSQSENDCTFNNDYKGLTKEWLKKVGITDYTWNDELSQAEVDYGKNILVITKGGCVHFNFLVKLIVSDDSISLNNTEYWKKTAIELATKFELNHYEKMLTTKKYNIVNARENLLLFEIEDNKIDDNLFYTGVVVDFENNVKSISLSKYYN